MTALTVRLPDATAAKLDELAQRLDCSPSAMVAQAVEDFIAREDWQVAEIEAALAEAEDGDFATDDELAQVVAKYVTPARRA